MSDNDAYFISDAHLGIPLAGYEDREKALIDFLKGLRGRARRLFVIGDLFDFWIEYGRLIRCEYFETVHVLKNLVEAGTEVHYMAGNHDFALGPFLPRYAGVQIHLDHWETEVQGRRLHLFHGDGILRIDAGYRMLRAILRNPLNQRLFKLLHPALGIAVATRFSGASRKYLGNLMTEARLREYRGAAAALLSKGCDIVVFGHTHRAELCTSGTSAYCNTGEWIRRYTYARLRDGVMSLWRHVPGGEPQPLEPIALKQGCNVS